MSQVSRLESVSVESPCPRRWSELVGDERRRFCSECQLHVTNLSALGRREGEAFLAENSGRVCVTYVPGARGGAAAREELSLPGRRGRLATHLARLAALFLGLLTFLPGCRPAEAQPGDDPDGADPRPDPRGVENGRIVGKVRADPVCVIDDQRMVMGEMVVQERPEPVLPEEDPPESQAPAGD